MKIVLKNMTGEQLFQYYSANANNIQYASIVKMLPYAVQNFEEACHILERCEREGKRLFAFYPGIGIETSMITEEEFNNLEFVGPIIDGGLYIK